MSERREQPARVDPRPPGARRPAMNHSVFAKLVAIMVMMAASLLLLVGGFFGFIVGPNLHTSVDVVLQEYTRGLAAGSLDLANAKDLSARLNLLVRYEGAATNWSTANDLPRIDDVQQGRVRKGTATLLRRNYYVVPAPDGGAYLFAWSLGPQMKEAHAALVVLLLLVMVAVVVITYIVLKRLLGPLRRLNDGVDRLSAGQLDVVLPNETHDEFGRLTDAFNHMVGRVRAMIGARDQLLLDVSHELRSPLTRMKVALELLPDGAQRNGMAADIAEMERMIAELLELERLRDGCRLRIVRHDLVPILREVAESFQDKPPGVRIVAPPGELLVDIDAQKIRTVVRNLLENAAKYSLPQSRPVEISAMQDDQTILIRVADDGPGIPEDEAERVFEPFYRLDRSRSKNTGGYGLGLSICKRVMEAHGGDITLERDRDKGASFTLTLPTPRESSIHPRAANSVSPTG